ncbi:MAG: hypothetical protein Kow00114_32930 [Kiloniellaceae bacterium]
MTETHAEALAELQAEAAEWKAQAEARMEELVALGAAAVGGGEDEIRTNIRGLIFARAEAAARPPKLVARIAEVVAILQQAERTLAALEAAAWKEASESLQGLLDRPDFDHILERFAQIARGEDHGHTGQE